MTTVYELMARLRADNQISPELARIAQSMTGILGLIGQGRAGFMSWGTALKGFAAILAGSEVLGGVIKIIEKTKELQTVLIDIRRMGGPIADYAAGGEAYKDAGNIARRLGGGLSTIDVLKVLPKIHSIVDSPVSDELSRKLWPSIAAYSALQYSDEKFSGDPTGKLRALMRAGMGSGRITDEHGDIDPSKLEKYLDTMARLKSLTHGMINEDTAYGLSQQGGPFLRSLSEEGFIAEMLVAQEIGGRRAGTSYLSMWQQLGAGVMTKKKAEQMEKIGLLPAGSWHTQKHSNAVEVDESALKSMTALLAKDPMALAKKLSDYFKSQDITNPEEQLRIIAGAFSRQTTQRLASQLLFDYQQLLKERGMTQQGIGAEGSLQMKMNEDISYNLEAVRNAWLDLLTAFASPNSKSTVDFLHSMRDAIWGLTDKVKATDVETLRQLGIGIAALGTALLAGGIGLVIAAIGPFGWLAGGLALLVGINYDKAKGIRGLVDDLMYYVDKIHTILGVMNAAQAAANIPSSLGTRTHDEAVRKGYIDYDHPRLGGYPGIFEPNAEDMTKHPISFNPGTDNKQILQPVMIKLDLDGRLLGQAVADILEDLFTHDMQAPFANRRASYSGPGQVQTG